MPVLLAHAIEDCTDIFGISGGFEPPLLGTPLLDSIPLEVNRFLKLDKVLKHTTI